MKRLILLLGLLLVVAGIGLMSLLREPARVAGAVGVEIRRGASGLEIGKQLEDAGLLRSRLLVYAYRALHPRARLQAGDYEFVRERSPVEVLDKIARGDVYARELTIPEGSSMFDIARIVEAEGLLRGEDFLRVAKDPQMIRDLAPGAPSLEGFLFPSTYKLPRKLTAEMLCQRMTRQFREVWKSLPGEGRPVSEVVALASLVEKESAIAEERPVIAGLFTQRLAKGMKLECDPTTIYAAQLEGRYRGKIYKSDLASENAYNTYQHKGLPPGPIANPGKESLLAALQPAATEAVFFVAEPGGSGRHVFSKTLAAHEQAVAKYRNGLKPQEGSARKAGGRK
jgi:UPF0755 protein